jgi:sugar lactone lactonase YvrE
MDAAGNLFIDDTGNSCVRRVSPDGTITTVVGIAGPGGFSGDGGPATKALLQDAGGVAVDAAGDLFVSDIENLRVRKVDAAGTITTVAGGGNPADGLGDGGPAKAAKLWHPLGVAVDPAGNLFIADPGWALKGGQFVYSADARVRKVDSAGTITTVAGGGHPADGRGDGGLATDAYLSGVTGVALDSAGNLYIVDRPDNRVRRVSPDGKIATVAGGGNPTDGVGDGGLATDARLDSPARMTVDPGGNLFIAENHGERIRKVSPAGIITTVAGTGRVGYTGDGGPAVDAQLDSPISVCLDRDGNLFFTEAYRLLQSLLKNGTPDARLLQQGNNLVREVIGVAVPQ